MNRKDQGNEELVCWKDRPNPHTLKECQAPGKKETLQQRLLQRKVLGVCY